MVRVMGYDVIGRLRPGASLERATDQMNGLAAAIDAENPTWRPGARVRVTPLHEHMVGKVRAWMLSSPAWSGSCWPSRAPTSQTCVWRR
jgi:hypothetical protein